MSTEIIINMENELENRIQRMSPEAKNALIKIGLDWRYIVGGTGSWVTDSMLKKAKAQQFPWSMNKITDNGRGRNGVKYSLVPTFMKLNLLIENTEGTNPTYMLTEIGKEVISAMLFNCNTCNNDRICRKCSSTGYMEELCQHTNMRDCKTCNGTGKIDDDECWECDAENDTCTQCNDKRQELCYSCDGKLKCNQCDSYETEA
jgi:hypothetical protein